MSSSPTSFKVHISDDDLARLRRKLEDSELPDRDIVPDAGWSYGVSLDWIKDLKKHWLEEYSWRKAEEEMNRWDHFKVDIDGVNLHYIYQRSKRLDAIPILLIHGWPGSFYEFHELIDPLVNPPEGQPAFHVVVPSVPGFIFSSGPPKQGWTVLDTAALFDKLMTHVLGYTSYAAQGGDWGSYVSTMLATNYPSCKAIHLNLCAVPPPFPIILAGLPFILPKWLSTRLLNWWFTPEEFTQLVHTKDFMAKGGTYYPLQATQPAMIGFALYDSPIGIMTWVGEKYATDTLNDPSRPISPSTILTAVSLYYFSGSFPTSCLPYKENLSLMGKPGPKITNSLLGVSVFAHDILGLPRHWVDKWHKGKLVFWRRHDHGGHFAALDSSAELLGDLREYFGAHVALFTNVP